MDASAYARRAESDCVPSEGNDLAVEMALVEKARALDSDAWEEIYNRYYRKIYYYLCRSLGNRDLAEDMASSVFLAAVEGIGGFTYRGVSLSAWLFKIAHNMSADHFRKNKVRTEPLVEESALEADLPEDIEEKRSEIKELSLAMGKITAEQRQVVILKFINGFSNAEVAKIINKPESAVKSLQHRGLASLRRSLEGGSI